jgi:hypothetical protein
MAVQTTEQPKCSEEHVGKASKSPSMFDKFRRKLVQFIKSGLCYLLLRPGTWRFLMVQVPDLIDKAWLFLKGIVSFFTDLL